MAYKPNNPISLDTASEDEKRASGAKNLKQIGLTLLRFSQDHDEALPPLSNQPGRLMLSPDALYPDYLDDLTFFICPSNQTSVLTESNEDVIDDQSYFYLSHAITNEKEDLAYVQAYPEAPAQATASIKTSSRQTAPYYPVFERKSWTI